jgi:Flp pilus assembly protein TadB
VGGGLDEEWIVATRKTASSSGGASRKRTTRATKSATRSTTRRTASSTRRSSSGALYPRRRSSRPGLPTTLGTALGTLVVTTLLDLSWPVRIVLVVVVVVAGLGYVLWRHRAELAAGGGVDVTPDGPSAPEVAPPPGGGEPPAATAPPATPAS